MTTPRGDYLAAIDHFVGRVSAAAKSELEGPGLGVWTRRELIAHAARALSTVDAYLVDDPSLVVDVETPAGYFAALAGGDQDAVAARGRQAALDAGADLPGYVAALAETARTRVLEASGRARARTPAGVMRLDDYLPTRTFELVVHSLDLDPQHAPGRELLGVVLSLLAELALERGLGLEAIQALTGRSDGLSLLN